MKNKKIYLIIIILVIIFLVIAAVGFVIKKKNTKPTNIVEDPKIVLTENSKIFKNIILEVDDTLEYRVISDNEFELKGDKWHANIEPIYDQYDHILSYPKCTQLYAQKYFEKGDNKTVGDINENLSGYKYFSFKLINEIEENIVMIYYKISDDYVLSIALINDDNSFKETGLEELLKVFKTVQINPKEKYEYTSFSSYFYHQCHDIDQYDAEEFERAIENDASLNEQANDSENTPSNEETQINQEETSENTNSTEE